MKISLLTLALVLGISTSSFGDVVNVVASTNTVTGNFVDPSLTTTEGSFLITTSSNQVGEGTVFRTQLGPNNGSQGIEVAVRGENDDGNAVIETLTYNFNVTAAPGFTLDTLTISQTPYSVNGTNGGFVNTNLPTLTLGGVNLADVTATDPSNQLSAFTQAGGAGTPVSFTASDNGRRLVHSIDDFSILLNNVTSGTNVSLTSTIAGGVDPSHGTDTFALNATFLPDAQTVPEPSSAAILGIIGLVFVGRRRRN